MFDGVVREVRVRKPLLDQGGHLVVVEFKPGG
jgi:hypothetical protein